VPDVQEVLAQCQWLISKGRGSEAAKLVLPRIEAKRRVANKEKRTRVQFDCDEQTYSDFHAERTRYVEACGNHPLIAYAIIIRLLRQLPTSSIQRLAAEDEPVRESLGDA
jgi:hypothetical protein